MDPPERLSDTLPVLAPPLWQLAHVDSPGAPVRANGGLVAVALETSGMTIRIAAAANEMALLIFAGI
jgi:hypothetical protein